MEGVSLVRTVERLTISWSCDKIIITLQIQKGYIVNQKSKISIPCSIFKSTEILRLYGQTLISDTPVQSLTASAEIIE